MLSRKFRSRTQVNGDICPGWSAERVTGESNLCVEEEGNRDKTTHQYSGLANGCSILVSDTYKVKPETSAPSVKADSSSRAPCGVSAGVSDCREYDFKCGKTTQSCDLMTMLSNDEVNAKPLLDEYNVNNIKFAANGGIDIIITVESVCCAEKPSEIVDVRAVTHSVTGGHSTSWGFELKDIIEAQSEEKEFVVVKDWLDKSKEPDPAKLLLSNPAVKFYWINKECVYKIDNVLYYKHPVSGESLLLVPSKFRDVAISLHHDLPSSGHQSYERTKARLDERFFWYGMSRDVHSFITGCEICNQN